MSYLVSWSGGKDSCLACYKAMQQGLQISHLINCVSKEYKRVNAHGLDPQLICLQAEALGIPLLQQLTTATNYAQEFMAAVNSVRSNATKGMVFGDIFLRDIKNWADEICAQIGITALEPLWELNSEVVVNEFLDAGFVAIVVSTDARLIGCEWLGHKLDSDFLNYLKTINVDVCGENGEYHTLVVDGPIFTKRIVVRKSRPVLCDGRWFLDTEEVGMEIKN